MKKWRIIRIIGAVLLLSIVVIIVLYIAALFLNILTKLPHSYRYVTAVEMIVPTFFVSGFIMLKLSYRMEEKEKWKEKSGG
ncbi:MAG: hypothetical protein LUE25_07510 [Clostridiales bacterium]|nr:hypothetical protein [Clostridiales bacterium]